MYDLIQGRREADIFSQGNVDNRPRTLSEAIKEVLKIDYNGKTGSNIVGVGSETGIERRRGSTGDVERGGRGTEGERAADGKGRAKGDAGEEGVAPFSERLQNAIAQTETEPTEAQKKAGNYKKGHLSFGGYDFTVETPKGVTRSGKDEQGKPWSVTMHDTYGYILGKIGVDGDHIDMFINDAADLDTFDGNVYVVDQVNPETGEFDEHKVMYGYPSEEAATEAYLANYSKGWKGLGKVTSVSKATFDKWLESSDRKTKPFADYAMVQKEQAKTNSDFIAQMEYDYENDIHPSEEDKPKMQKFVERLLNFHSDKEDKIDSGYTILSSNIQGDKLYPNEKKWFGTKKYRQGVSWVDKENACVYELNPRFNAQGYLTAVGVHKLVPLASFGRDVNEVKPSDIARATGKSQGKVTAKASKKQGKGKKKVEPGQQVDYYSAFAEQYGLDAEEAKKETEGNKPSEASLSLSTPLTDEEVVAITDAMKANATVAPTVEINDANWKESVDTPIGAVKMGENQKAKLFAKGREQQYGMLLETLSNPDVVLEEKDKEQNMFHERPSSYLFVKTFQKEDGSKYVHFESVTVSQEGMEVSISSHIIRENQLKNKLKSDRLLYKATALDAPANTSAEQPIVGGSLSSDGKFR